MDPEISASRIAAVLVLGCLRLLIVLKHNPEVKIEVMLQRIGSLTKFIQKPLSK